MAEAATAQDTALLDAIAEQREKEERVRRECDASVADEHRRSVELWARAYDQGVGYVEIASRVGVTRAYVRAEVLKLKAGQL